jgi:hypothetical protein
MKEETFLGSFTAAIFFRVSVVVDSGRATPPGDIVSGLDATFLATGTVVVPWALERGATANIARAAVRTVNVTFMVFS